VTAKELSVRSAFESLGFNETDTGGGCTAWVMALSQGRAGDCADWIAAWVGGQ